MTEFKSFYKKAGGDEGSRCLYPYRLDLYGKGCYHDCSYCYAKSLLSFRGLWDADNPAEARWEDICKVMNKLEPGSVVRLGGMTDCFQPYEEQNHLTLDAIKFLNERGIHYLIVTKSPLVATDEYMSALDHKLAHIQVSISCTDTDLASKIERCASPQMRIEAAEKLQEAGFDTSLRISPYLIEYVDHAYLERCKVKKALVEFLRVNHWIEKWLPIDTSAYTHKEGGYRHLPLDEKERALAPIMSAFDEVSVCEDVDTHYRLFNALVNANPRDCCNLRMGD